ncbi:MAG: PIN domain protein [Candidatus Omnitrophota bacterium]|nr:MAG: PIN domain protein [Candidatus Omnitrophota bacterium]
MKIYLDNCCLNRPFDDQSQIRIRLESEAKLKIQDDIRAGRFQLVWSYILDLENDNNPYDERRKQIEEWKIHSVIDVQENAEILSKSKYLIDKGMRKLDALHIACAIFSKCDYFLTTDDKVLKKDNLVTELKIVDPFFFIKETEK